MYIAIYVNEKGEELGNIKTLSDVLEVMLELLEDAPADKFVVKYATKEEFIDDLEAFMEDSIEGFIIGVDVPGNSFEIMHIKYEWVIKNRVMTPEK